MLVQRLARIEGLPNTVVIDIRRQYANIRMQYDAAELQDTSSLGPTILVLTSVSF